MHIPYYTKQAENFIGRHQCCYECFNTLIRLVALMSSLRNCTRVLTSALNLF